MINVIYRLSSRILLSFHKISDYRSFCFNIYSSLVTIIEIVTATGYKQFTSPQPEEDIIYIETSRQAWYFTIMYDWTLVRYGKVRDRPRQRIYYPNDHLPDRGHSRTYADAVKSSSWTGVRNRMEENRPRRRDPSHFANEHYYIDGNNKERYYNGNSREQRPDVQGRRGFNGNQPTRTDNTRYYKGNSREQRPNVQKGRGFNGNQPTRTDNTSKQDYTSQKNTELGKQIRIMYTLIRQVHHLNNVKVSEDVEDIRQPVTFKRLTSYLMDIIKPVSMTDSTRELLDGNARNWAYTTQLILANHYLEGIQDTLSKLETLLTTEWHLAFEIATKWSRRKFKNQIMQETFDRAEAHIVAMAQREEQMPRPQTTEETHPIRGSVTQKLLKTCPRRVCRESQKGGTLSMEVFPPPQTSPGTHSPIRQRRKRISNPYVAGQVPRTLSLEPVSTQASTTPAKAMINPPVVSIQVHQPIEGDQQVHTDPDRVAPLKNNESDESIPLRWPTRHPSLSELDMV